MTGHTTPAEARDLHHGLIGWYGSAAGQSWCDARSGFELSPELFQDGYGAEPFEAAVSSRVVQQRMLRAAETFLVSDEMSAVARQAAAKLPDRITVHRGTLPAQCGFLVFNDRAADHPTGALPLEVVSWWQTVLGDLPGVMLLSYVRAETALRLAELEETLGMDGFAERVRSPILPALWTFVPYDIPVNYGLHDGMADVARMLVATWLLMDQPLAVRERPAVSRADGKRAARAGLVSDLTVIRLRSPRGMAGEPGEGREYSHRWLVRGHWRHIPTPEEPDRITWVHGYVKGPDDAPLRVTDRVTVLSR